MLGVAIGLATAMFAIVDALLIRPLPFDGADRMSQIYMGNDHGGRTAVAASVLDAWKSSEVFDAVFGLSAVEALVETGAGPQARQAALISPDAFESLGVRAIRGRLFDPEDGREGTDDRVVLSEDLWRSSFDADPALIGQRVTINDRQMLVVGILPADFRFPSWNTLIWMPMNFDAPPSASTVRPVTYVWFSQNVPRSDAVRVATTLAHEADPATSELRVIESAVVRSEAYYAQALPLLAGGVGLVFLVLCANVASLMLTQQMARQRDFSIVSALGASRGRLIRQAAVESALIGLAGSLVGMAFAVVLVSLTRGFLPEAILVRTLNTLELDWRALVAASAAGITATLLAGVLPAWIGTRVRAANALHSSRRSVTQTRAARAATRALITSEVALAFALLVGTALLGRSFLNLAAADRGLDASGVISSWLMTPAVDFPDRASRLVARNAVYESLMALPSVADVVLSSGVPPRGGATHFSDDWRSDVTDAPDLSVVSSYYVGADFFELYRIPIVAGRTFRPGDTDTDVIVGERMADALWPGLSAVGHTFESVGLGLGVLRVIGVAGEIALPALDPKADRPEFYFPFTPDGSRAMLSIRCKGPCPDPAVISQTIRRAHPHVQDLQTRVVEDDFTEPLARPRAVAGAGIVLGLVALFASAGGLFSVLSYAVGLRQREFGIRAALGATRPALWRVVFHDGIGVVVIGLSLGSLLAWWFARLTMSLQYGVTPSDPVSWIAVAIVLLLTSLAAAWRPARRAGRADPARLLRAD